MLFMSLLIKCPPTLITSKHRMANLFLEGKAECGACCAHNKTTRLFFRSEIGSNPIVTIVVARVVGASRVLNLRLVVESFHILIDVIIFILLMASIIITFGR